MMTDTPTTPEPARRTEITEQWRDWFFFYGDGGDEPVPFSQEHGFEELIGRVRAQALEEAAQIACDSMRKSQEYNLGQAAIIAGDIAERIRALKAAQPPRAGEA